MGIGNMITFEDEVESRMSLAIRERILSRIKNIPWDKLACDECFIGGNSCNRAKPKDYDLFPVGKGLFDNKGLEVICKTSNAQTLRADGIVIQLCNYKWDTVKALVDSFDFSHIQIGAKLSRVSERDMRVDEVYYTDEWVKSKCLESSEFVGSQFPLSSLMRLAKYHKRDYFSGNTYMFEIMKVLVALIERGVTDYDDFKNQMDAVDLGLTPQDADQLETSVLGKLFTLLRKDKVK